MAVGGPGRVSVWGVAFYDVDRMGAPRPPPEKTSGPSSNSTGGSSCYRLIADPFESPRPKGGDGGPDFAPLGKHRKYRLYSRKTD